MNDAGGGLVGAGFQLAKRFTIAEQNRFVLMPQLR